MRRTARLAALTLVAFGACRTLPPTPQPLLTQLAATPGSYLAGTPLGLREPAVLNREDFVYDARLAPSGSAAAFTRLGLKAFHLSLVDLAPTPPRPLGDLELNPTEFDVEALEFSPDGAVVATGSRDGALRLVDARTGQARAAWLTDEPLVSLAWHPDGKTLALGSSRGLVSLVSFPELTHLGELRAHADEVRALAFTPEGQLVSAGWDRKLAVFALDAAGAPSAQVRLRFERKAGVVTFRAVLDAAASAQVTLDARLPVVAIRPALAQALGVDSATLADSVTIPTALGNQLARVAHGRRLALKGLVLEGLDVAICDACVPPGAQAALGGPVVAQLEQAFDEQTQELVLSVKPASQGVRAAPGVTLRLVRGVEFPAPLNDLSLSARGDVAGVAFSETKAERTRAVYEREKKKEPEPERPWDCGARIELSTGKVLSTVHGHRGVVATAALSPDGATLVTGGWDKKLVLHLAPPVIDERFGWSVRRARFSRDGRFLVVAAWTPQNPLGDHRSDPSALVYEVAYGPDASVLTR